MKKTYKIPKKYIYTVDYPSQIKKSTHNDKKLLISSTITFYIKLNGLKPKKTSFYNLEKYNIGDIFVLDINMKLFDRLRKISKITKRNNKEIKYVNELLKNKIDIMDYLQEEIIKSSKIPKKYIYTVDYPSQIMKSTHIDKKIVEKFNKFITQLKNNMI